MEPTPRNSRTSPERSRCAGETRAIQMIFNLLEPQPL